MGSRKNVGRQLMSVTATNIAFREKMVKKSWTKNGKERKTNPWASVGFLQ
jgi:hypothetical protein